MSDTLYENYTDQQAVVGYRTAHWGAMTFTPQIAHDITSVILKLHQTDAIALGDVTCSIRAVDGSSHPTGVDQAWKTVTHDFGTVGVEYEFVFDNFAAGSKYSLEASRMYAIVLRAPSAPVNKYLYSGRRFTDPAYLRGATEDSVNSGADWTTLTQDWYFKEYGIAIQGGGGIGSLALLIAQGVI